MKNRTWGVAIAAAALGMTIAPAFSDADGAPNANACAGQVTSRLAQDNPLPFGLTSAKGVADVATAEGLTTAQLVAGIKAFCRGH